MTSEFTFYLLSIHRLVCSEPQSTLYKEYHSVCHLVGIGTLPTPLSPASVPLPPEQGGRGGSTISCGWRVGGVPIPTTGEKASTLPIQCSEHTPRPGLPTRTPRTWISLCEVYLPAPALTLVVYPPPPPTPGSRWQAQFQHSHMFVPQLPLATMLVFTTIWVFCTTAALFRVSRSQIFRLQWLWAEQV